MKIRLACLKVLFEIWGKKSKKTTKPKPMQHISAFSNSIFQNSKICILIRKRNINSMCISINILPVPITWKVIELKILCQSVPVGYSCSGCNICSLHSTILFTTVVVFSLPIFKYFSSAQHLPKEAKQDPKNTPKTTLKVTTGYWHNSKALAVNPK